MRALGPLPLTLERSTPSVRAKARTDGDACAPRNAWSSTGAAAGLAGGAGSAAAAVFGEGAAEGAGTGASAFAPAAPPGAAAPVVSRVRKTLPSLTLSPTLTFNSLTVPADGAGTSIVALSDSSVTSGSSGFTTSPGLTKTSMTGTSLKSPMSGTLTATAPVGPAAEGACAACSFGLASCAAVGAASLGLVAGAAAGAASVPAGRDALAAGAALPPPSADSSVRIALP